MAKVTIEIEDVGGDQIDINAVFDPEYNQAHKASPAQNLSAYVLEELARLSMAKGGSTDEEAEEGGTD